MTEINFNNLRIKNKTEAYLHYDSLSKNVNELIENNKKLKIHYNELYGQMQKSKIGSFKDIHFREEKTYSGFNYSLKIGDNLPINVNISKDDYNKKSTNSDVKKEFEKHLVSYLQKVKIDVMNQLDEKMNNCKTEPENTFYYTWVKNRT